MAFWYCSSWAAYAATFSKHLLAELKPRTRAGWQSQRKMTRHLSAPSLGPVQETPREKAEVCLSSHITKLLDPFITHHKTVRTFHHMYKIVRTFHHVTKLSEPFITRHQTVTTFHHMTQTYQNLSHDTNLSEPFITHQSFRTFHHISQNCKKNNTCLLDSSPL